MTELPAHEGDDADGVPQRHPSRPRFHYRQRGSLPDGTDMLLHSGKQHKNSGSRKNKTDNSSRKPLFAGIAALVLIGGFLALNFFPRVLPAPYYQATAPASPDFVAETDAADLTITVSSPAQTDQVLLTKLVLGAAEVDPDIPTRPWSPPPEFSAQAPDRPAATALIVQPLAPFELAAAPALGQEQAAPTLPSPTGSTDATPAVTTGSLSVPEILAPAETIALPAPVEAPVVVAGQSDAPPVLASANLDSNPNPEAPFVCDDCVVTDPRLASVALDVKIPANLSANLQARRSGAARTLGAAELTEDTTTIPVAQTQVRYYHSEDAEAARIVANQFGATLVDLTWVKTAPPANRIELWFAAENAP